MSSWKQAPLKQAIMACRANMIDDAEAMLNAWAINDNTHVAGVTRQEKGQTAFIPVMTTAIAPIMSPPDFEQVGGHSAWLDVVAPNDPENRVVQLRTMPVAYRCQIAFFSPDVHGAMMVANQFCLYWKNESKRTFDVQFELGYFGDQKITDNWKFRVLENSLYPDTATTDYKNLTVVTVDCTIIGSIPIIGGLGGDWDDITDTGEIGTPPNVPPIVGDRPPDIVASKGLLVTDADVLDVADAKRTLIHADPDTGIITQTEVNVP